MVGKWATERFHLKDKILQATSQISTTKACSLFVLKYPTLLSQSANPLNQASPALPLHVQFIDTFDIHSEFLCLLRKGKRTGKADWLTFE